MSVELKQGLVNSMIVLELLRNDEQLNRCCEIYVECFINCRECGLTFTLHYCKDDNEKIFYPKFDNRWTYCVYEHRNSDQIIINGKKNWTSWNGDLPYSEDNAHKYFASFNYGEHYKAYQWLKDKFLEERKQIIYDAQ